MGEIRRTRPRLTDWTDLAGEISGVPREIDIAISSGRGELARLLKRPLNEQESRSIGNAIAVLIETVAELQRHSAQVAERARNTRGAVLGALRQLENLRDFANFKDGGTDDEE
jgi:hypothetical protein